MLNSLRPQLEKAWIQLQAQLQASQRLRWMFWAIAYIFVIYFGLTLSEWRQERNDHVSQLQRTSVKLERLKTQTQWPERWQQEKELAEKLRAKLWVAESGSLAEADLQNYIRRVMTVLNAQNLRLRLAPTEVVELGGQSFTKVTADVTGVIPTAQIDQLLNVMAQSPKVLVIERFGYSPQRAEQFSLLLSAYFLIEEKAAPETEKGVRDATVAQ
jgi:hypothetical protein